MAAPTLLKGSVSFGLKATQSEALALATFVGTVQPTHSKLFEITDLDLLWSDRRILTGSETLNLTSGLFDAYNNSVVFYNLRVIFIENLSTANTLTIGGGSTPVLNYTQALVPTTPNGTACFALDTNIVISGSNNLLQINAGSNTITYNIVLLGEEAHMGSSSSSSSSSSYSSSSSSSS